MLVSRDSATNALENSVIDGVSGRVAFWMLVSRDLATNALENSVIDGVSTFWMLVSRDLATNALENSVIDGVVVSFSIPSTLTYIYSHHPMQFESCV